MKVWKEGGKGLSSWGWEKQERRRMSCVGKKERRWMREEMEPETKFITAVWWKSLQWQPVCFYAWTQIVKGSFMTLGPQKIHSILMHVFSNTWWNEISETIYMQCASQGLWGGIRQRTSTIKIKPPHRKCKRKHDWNSIIRWCEWLVKIRLDFFFFLSPRSVFCRTGVFFSQRRT